MAQNSAASSSDLVQPKHPSYYPDIFTPVEEKSTKNYALQVAKALYYQNWSVYQNGWGLTDRNRMIDNRAWSNGNFDVTAFMGGRQEKNRRSKNPFLKQIDFDPVTEMPKYRDIVVGYMEDLDFEVLATSINPAAAAERENRYLSELALLKMKEAGIAQDLEASAGAPVVPQSQMKFPVTNQQELDIYFQTSGAKEIYEIEMSLANKIVLNDSRWKDIKKKLLEDAFDTGRMIVDHEYDKTGRVKIKYVDAVNCGVENYRGHYLNRPIRIWYVELMTVQDILVDAGDQFRHDEAQKIAEMYSNQWGNPAWSTLLAGYQMPINTDMSYPTPYAWYNFKVPVMKLYWQELDYYKMATVEKFGKEVVKAAAASEKSEIYYDHSRAGRPPQERKKTVNEYAIHNYYQCKWIVNTDFAWDYGKVPFQARDPFDIRFALCPLKYYRVAVQPIAERAKTFAKKLYMTYQKLDQEVASKIPSGYRINVRALENISLGQGETFTVKHAIELVNETGRMVYADEALADEMGRSRRKDPIEVFDTGTPFHAAINGWNALIQMYEQRLAQVTGLNDIMNASNPNPETPVTLAKLAEQGTNHSLSQIASAMLNMAEYIALDVTERVRLLIQETGESYGGYATALGSGMAGIVKVSPAVTAHRFAIEVKAKPTARERERLKQWVAQAFANMASPEQGGLWVSDVVHFEQMIDEGVDMKLIRVMMEARQKANLAQVQQMKMQAIQQQAQLNSQNTMDAAKAEIDAYREKKMIDLQYEQMMTMEINKREQAKAQQHTEGKLITDTHKSGLKQQEELFKA